MKHYNEWSNTLTSIALLLIVLMLLPVGVWGQTTPTLPRMTFTGLMVDSRYNNLMDKDENRVLVHTAERARFTTLLPLVFANGTVYYDSSIVPLSPLVDSSFPDPLTDLLHECQNAGINGNPVNVYARFNLLEAYGVDFLPPSKHVLIEHPDWIMLDAEGKESIEGSPLYLDPGIPAVRKHLIDIVREFCEKYGNVSGMEGIVFEGLRYPDIDCGYSELALKAYTKVSESDASPDPRDEQWMRWRSRQIDMLLSRIVATVKKIQPDLRVGVVVDIVTDPPNSLQAFKKAEYYQAHLQNWIDWFKNGKADFILIKNFRNEDKEDEAFDAWNDVLVSAEGKSALWIAMAGFLNFSNTSLHQVKKLSILPIEGLVISHYRKPAKDNPDIFYRVLGNILSSPILERLVDRKNLVPLDLGIPSVPLEPESESITTPTLATRFTTPTLATSVTTPTLTIPSPTSSTLEQSVSHTDEKKVALLLKGREEPLKGIFLKETEDDYLIRIDGTEVPVTKDRVVEIKEDFSK